MQNISVLFPVLYLSLLTDLLSFQDTVDIWDRSSLSLSLSFPVQFYVLRSNLLFPTISIILNVAYGMKLG
jgi:hypothetical protein